MSNLEASLALQLTAIKATGFEREYRFYDKRKWRFDFAWPEHKLALEVEGGIWCGGRHTRGSGFQADCNKYNTAAVLGWTVLRVTARDVENGTALLWVEWFFGTNHGEKISQK